MRASAESSGSSRARVGLCWACAGGGERPADRVMGRGRGTIQSHTPFKYLRTLLTGAPITSAREGTRLHATSTKKTFRQDTLERVLGTAGRERVRGMCVGSRVKTDYPNLTISSAMSHVPALTRNRGLTLTPGGGRVNYTVPDTRSY